MADADYGYVGSGTGKVNLYKRSALVYTNLNENIAVDTLISLIKESGDWKD
jgi:(E)-4-hydroxy-3-methylbut-2-enyl-diphosphate synthase